MPRRMNACLQRAASLFMVGGLLIVLAGGVLPRSVRFLACMGNPAAPAQVPGSGQEEETVKEKESIPARASRRSLTKHLHQRTTPVSISCRAFQQFCTLTAAATALDYRDGAGAYLRC